jgi:hypothetical protein
MNAFAEAKGAYIEKAIAKAGISERPRDQSGHWRLLLRTAPQKMPISCVVTPLAGVPAPAGDGAGAVNIPQ